MREVCFLFLAFFIFFSSFAQSDSTQLADSVALAKARQKQLYQRPKRAGIMSAILPGLGQGYNGKYWKIPIIYAGLAGGAYVYAINNQSYNLYRNALRNSVSDSTNVAAIDGISYTSDELVT